MTTTTAQARPTTAQTGTAYWLYRLAGLCTLTMIALVVLDIAISAASPDVAPGSLTAIEWFAVFQAEPFRAMRDLGVLNILNSILGIPVFLALYVLHRRTQSEGAALALVLFLFGSAIYIANNTVLPMLALSGQYAAATTEAQRAALAAAGEAMLARGADFTPGSLVGFVLPSLANILMAVVVLRGDALPRMLGIAGLVGFPLLLAFTVWVTLYPAGFDAAMLIAFPAGIAVLVWNGMLAWWFLRAKGFDHE